MQLHIMQWRGPRKCSAVSKYGRKMLPPPGGLHLASIMPVLSRVLAPSSQLSDHDCCFQRERGQKGHGLL